MSKNNQNTLPATIPTLNADTGLNRYLTAIRKYPILSPEKEYMLAKRYSEHGDPDAAAQLVNSHLRLVAKIAMKFRNYGLPVAELISEGNVGLMQGVKKFDPERGFRLATYAMWWIRASIQEYILHSWSLVKIGTTAAQKKLFFNLRQMKNKLQHYDDGDLAAEDVEVIAAELNVPEHEVVDMNRRTLMGGDASLNVTGQSGEGQWQDWLTADEPLQDEQLADSQEGDMRREMLQEAITKLGERERNILIERRLASEPKTLDELSEVHNVSRERIRQIEKRAFEKLQKAMLNLAKEQRMLPA